MPLAPFTENQVQYLQRCFSSWLNVLEGGKRGGKNVVQTVAFAASLEDHPDRIHLIAGVTVATAKLNVIDCDGMGLLYHFGGRCREGKYKDRDCLYISTRTGEKIVLISGGGRSGDEKLIKGNSYGSALITEANECTPMFIKEVFDRTLASNDRKIFHDFNPKSPGHWYYEDILNFQQRNQDKDPNYGLNYGHMTIADNLSISDEQLKATLKTYERGTLWWARDIEGKRQQAEGLVYPMFDHSHIIPTMHRTYYGYQISIDYGTQNPFSMGLWGKFPNESMKRWDWIRIKEWYYDGRKDGAMTDDEYYNQLVKFADIDFGTQVNGVDQVIIDPSASSFITLIRRKGQFKVKPANNDVDNGIRNVATALKRGIIKVNDCCKDTIREFGLYSWDEKAKEDTPIKENDHAMDEIRYFVHTNNLVQPPRMGLLQ